MRTWSSLAGDGDNSNDTSAPVTIEKAAFVGTFPYTESWENGPGGWTVTGTNSSWELGMPQNTVIDTAADGTNAWVTGLDSTYNLSEQSFLASPCFDFSGFAADPFVTFSLSLIHI